MNRIKCLEMLFNYVKPQNPEWLIINWIGKNKDICLIIIKMLQLEKSISQF